MRVGKIDPGLIKRKSESSHQEYGKKPRGRAKAPFWGFLDRQRGVMPFNSSSGPMQFHKLFFGGCLGNSQIKGFAFAFVADRNRVAFYHLAVQQEFGKRVFKQALHGP